MKGIMTTYAKDAAGAAIAVATSALHNRVRNNDATAYAEDVIQLMKSLSPSEALMMVCQLGDLVAAIAEQYTARIPEEEATTESLLQAVALQIASAHAEEE